MPTPESSDALLVVRCQLGDQEAWRILVERWQPRLWAFILRLGPDDSLAEDVLQTVWLRVVRSMVRLREPGRWPAWVFGIARATMADRFRQDYRRPQMEMAVDVAGEDSSADQVANTEWLRMGLTRLHPLDRESVILHYLEELPVNDVAEICGVPAGTIKSRLHRARQILRRTLNQ